MKGGIRRGDSCSPMALNSVFGWLLSGPTGVKRTKSFTASTHHATTKILEDDPNLILKKFWNLESIGVTEEPEKAQMYKDAVNQYLKDGHARLVTAEDEKTCRIHYLPHHPVFRQEKSTTKCRAVFDAAAKSTDGVSLNDCVLPGPALQPDLVSLLIRFRCHRVGMMADVRKMFLQIKIAPKDQNVHRFFWRDLNPNEKIKTY